MKSTFGIIVSWLLTASALLGNSTFGSSKYPVSLDTITLYDTARHREIPIAIYQPKTDKKIKNQKIVIISHGYNENRKGSYFGYSFLAEHLASTGIFVVSIQHELPTDSLVPLTGIPQIVRRPFWERGADNIYYVINELKKTKPNINFKHISLIGHSMGGDMTALFPQRYPGVVEKIITFDNRRMPLPRTKLPRVYSLRSSDQKADDGVLPTKEEMKKYRMKIIKLPNTIHNDMCNNANEEQRKEIIRYVMMFLKEKG